MPQREDMASGDGQEYAERHTALWHVLEAVQPGDVLVIQAAGRGSSWTAASATPAASASSGSRCGRRARPRTTPRSRSSCRGRTTCPSRWAGPCACRETSWWQTTTALSWCRRPWRRGSWTTRAITRSGRCSAAAVSTRAHA
ncbi:unnamed protein product [Penicillium discolor]